MKTIYLINYTDKSDDTDGCICASTSPVATLSATATESIKEWLRNFECFDKEEIITAVGKLQRYGFAEIGDFEIYSEETILYD